MNVSLVQLLAKLGHINPAVWDAIIPHGPASIAISSAEAAELNPQPLPPAAKLQLASAEVAEEIARAASAADAAGNSEASSAIVARAIEDWCGTPWPKPWQGPIPKGGGEEEEFMPSVDTSRIIGALTLASIASRMTEGELRDSLGKGAEQLLEVGVAG